MPGGQTQRTDGGATIKSTKPKAKPAAKKGAALKKGAKTPSPKKARPAKDSGGSFASKLPFARFFMKKKPAPEPIDDEPEDDEPIDVFVEVMPSAKRQAAGRAEEYDDDDDFESISPKRKTHPSLDDDDLDSDDIDDEADDIDDIDDIDDLDEEPDDLPPPRKKGGKKDKADKKGARKSGKKGAKSGRGGKNKEGNSRALLLLLVLILALAGAYALHTLGYLDLSSVIDSLSTSVSMLLSFLPF